MKGAHETRAIHISLSSGGEAELRRCDDSFFCRAQEHSMPIEILSSRSCTLLSRVGLAKTYAALTALTGASGDLFDDWKGAFSFPFKLTVRRGDREFRYLLNLANFRSMVDPSLYRLLQAGESYSRRTYHAPFDDELGAEDIDEVLGFLQGYVEGYLKTMPKWTTPFVKEVQSNLILFGYDPERGDFFTTQYRDQKAYQVALTRRRASLPEEVSERQKITDAW